MTIPEPTGQRPRLERGLLIHGGEVCYVCELPVRNGDPVVHYFDARFWETGFLYHADCWGEADLDAKQFGEESACHAPALVLPEVECATCEAPIATGEVIVRLRERTRAQDPRIRPLLPEVHHAACFTPDAH